jgi:hypothetical protein
MAAAFSRKGSSVEAKISVLKLLPKLLTLQHALAQFLDQGDQMS